LLRLNPDLADFDFPLSRVLEYAVMEYPFAFWQYAPNDCATIPTADSSIASMAAHLEQQATLNYFNKSFSEAFRPFFV
jgi:hypothetical protein